MRSIASLKQCLALLEAVLNADPVWDISSLAQFPADPDWQDFVTVLNDARRLYGLPPMGQEHNPEGPA